MTKEQIDSLKNFIAKIEKSPDDYSMNVIMENTGIIWGYNENHFLIGGSTGSLAITISIEKASNKSIDEVMKEKGIVNLKGQVIK